MRWSALGYIPLKRLCWFSCTRNMTNYLNNLGFKHNITRRKKMTLRKEWLPATLILTRLHEGIPNFSLPVNNFFYHVVKVGCNVILNKEHNMLQYSWWIMVNTRWVLCILHGRNRICLYLSPKISLDQGKNIETICASFYQTTPYYLTTWTVKSKLINNMHMNDVILEKEKAVQLLRRCNYQMVLGEQMWECIKSTIPHSIMQAHMHIFQ